MSKRQTAESECRQCYARILWATNSVTRGAIPLNLRPEKITASSAGPFYMLNDLNMVCTKADAPVVEQAIETGRSLYSNHLVTCEKRNAVRAAAD